MMVFFVEFLLNRFFLWKKKRVRERLLREDDLTLLKTMQICQAAEATEKRDN